jgi:hypothetical protein
LTRGVGPAGEKKKQVLYPLGRNQVCLAKFIDIDISVSFQEILLEVQ